MKDQYVVREGITSVAIEGLINAEARNGYELVSLCVAHAPGYQPHYVAVMKLRVAAQ